MTTDASDLDAASETPPPEVVLTCPECEYNLTGLTENRCPECGTAFDPEQLRQLLLGTPAPIPGWGDPNESSVVVRYWRTCLMAWFAPREFGRRFPWSYSLSSTWRFWLASRILTVVLIWITVAVTYDMLNAKYELALGFIGIPCTAVCGAVVCELLVSLALALLTQQSFQPSQVSDGSSSSWLGLVCMYGSFQPLSVIVIGLFIAVGMRCHLRDQEFDTGQLILLTVMWAWWSSSLGAAISVRVESGIGVVIARCLIPLLGVLSMLLGLMSGLCAGIH